MVGTRRRRRRGRRCRRCIARSARASGPEGLGIASTHRSGLEDGELGLTEEGVAGINGAIVYYADQQVFAHDEDFTYSRQYNEKPRQGAACLKTPFLFGKKQKAKGMVIKRGALLRWVVLTAQ